MRVLQIPWAVCRGNVGWAESCVGRSEDKSWYRCPKCDERLVFCQGRKRNSLGKTIMRNHFKHYRASDCRGGNVMSYQHKMTQLALKAYRGPVRLLCCDRDCEGTLRTVVNVELESRIVNPFAIDAVLTTSTLPIAVEVTYTHATADCKWFALERKFGRANTVEIDVSKADIDSRDGSFCWSHALGSRQYIVVDKNFRTPVMNLGSRSCLLLCSRIDSCEACTRRKRVQETVDSLVSGVEEKVQRDQITEFERKGFVKCSGCSEYTEKAVQKTYWNFVRRCKVTDCCGWKMCSECDRKAICRSSWKSICIACERNKLPTTNERCDATAECKQYALKGHEWGYCRYHQSWKSCITCGFGFKPQQRWCTSCVKCYSQYAAQERQRQETVAMFAKPW